MKMIDHEMKMEQPILKHFKVQEFVDPKTYKIRGDNSIHIMDRRLVLLADWLRIKSGSGLTINDWAWGGGFKWSGLRTGESGYSNYSMHMTGNALDLKSKVHSPRELQRIIEDNFEDLLEYTGLTGLRIEHTSATPTWLHVDSFQFDYKIYVFYP